MIEVEPDQLKQAVEGMHGCKASFMQSVPVREMADRKVVWEGIVGIFALTGHPTASRAYAWSSPVAGSDQRRFFAVLHAGAIDSPLAAIRAAIVAEHRAK